MKIGVKTFGDVKFLEHFKDKVDFFEIMAAQKNDYSFLRKFSLPIVIHAEHSGFGINYADISKKEENIKSISFAMKLADKVNAGKIIVHPGLIERKNKNYSEKNAIDFIKELNDRRILIENLHGSENLKNTYSLCRKSGEVKKFMKKTNTKFCFDINHALACIKNFNENYNFMKKYVKLNPAHYHLGGQSIKDKQTHLCFEKSDLNLREVFRYLPKDAEITLEVETDIKKVEKDIDIIKKVINELKT